MVPSTHQCLNNLAGPMLVFVYALCAHWFWTVLSWVAVGVAKTLLQVDGLPGEREVRAAVAAALDAKAQPAPRSGSPDGPEALEPGDSGCSAAAADADGQVRPLAGSGCWLPLLGPQGEELGAALCAGGASSSNRASSGGGQPASRRPIFVSVGHRVGLATALAVVQRCCIYRWGPASQTAPVLRVLGLAWFPA